MRDLKNNLSRYLDQVEIWDKSRLIGKSRRSTWADVPEAEATIH